MIENLVFRECEFYEVHYVGSSVYSYLIHSIEMVVPEQAKHTTTVGLVLVQLRVNRNNIECAVER